MSPKGNRKKMNVFSAHGLYNNYQEFKVTLNDVKAIIHYVTGPVSNK